MKIFSHKRDMSVYDTSVGTPGRFLGQKDNRDMTNHREDKLEQLLRKVSNAVVPTALTTGFMVVATADVYRGGHSGEAVRSSVHALALLLTWYVCSSFTKGAAAIVSGTFIAIAFIYTVWQTWGDRGFCTDCGSGSWLFLVAIGSASIASVGRLTVSEKNSTIRSVLGLICFAVPIVQLVLLTLYAKMCPSCIAAGCSAVSVLRFTTTSDASGRAISLPLKLVLVPLFVVGSATLIGSVFKRPASDSPVPSQTITSMRVAKLKLGSAGVLDGVVLLYLPGCHWCEETRGFFKQRGIKFSEVDLSTISSDSVLERTFAPQVLVLRSGFVAQHIRGYNEGAMSNLRK